MKLLLKRKTLISLCLVFVLCLGTLHQVGAGTKIKSKSVSLNSTNITVGVGDIFTLTATMKPTNSTDSLKWSSSNKKVAAVNKNGTVTAKTTGTAAITVKTSSKKTAKCIVTVKSYLSETEIENLIASKSLSEETVLRLINDNSLSEDKVKAMIAQNSLSEEAVLKLINDHSLSEESVSALIAQNSLSEDAILKLINDNSLSEETVKTLITQNSLSEETVLNLIDENTLSEAEVKSLIQSGGTGTGTTDDWEDGTQLTLFTKQTLPYSFTEDLNGNSCDGTITSVEISKSHFEDFLSENHRKNYYKYKYNVTITGKITGSASQTSVYFTFANDTTPGTGTYIISHLNEDGTFLGTEEIYLNADYNSFYFNSIKLTDPNE